MVFGNGGELTVRDFRLDVPDPDVAAADWVAAALVAHLGLHTVGTVSSPQSAVDHRAAQEFSQLGVERPAGRRLVDLTHVIAAGMVTYPRLPGPESASI